MYVTIIKVFKVQYFVFLSIQLKLVILKFSDFRNDFDSDSLKSHFFNQTK